MINKITDKYIKFVSCESVFPINPISENDNKRQIDANLWIDYNTFKGACLIDAIKSEFYLKDAF